MGGQAETPNSCALDLKLNPPQRVRLKVTLNPKPATKLNPRKSSKEATLLGLFKFIREPKPQERILVHAPDTATKTLKVHGPTLLGFMSSPRVGLGFSVLGFRVWGFGFRV